MGAEKFIGGRKICLMRSNRTDTWTVRLGVWGLDTWKRRLMVTKQMMMGVCDGNQAAMRII